MFYVDLVLRHQVLLVTRWHSRETMHFSSPMVSLLSPSLRNSMIFLMITKNSWKTSSKYFRAHVLRTSLINWPSPIQVHSSRAGFKYVKIFNNENLETNPSKDMMLYGSWIRCVWYCLLCIIMLPPNTPHLSNALTYALLRNSSIQLLRFAMISILRMISSLKLIRLWKTPLSQHGSLMDSGTRKVGIRTWRTMLLSPSSELFDFLIRIFA